jgi:hypothetical protein
MGEEGYISNQVRTHACHLTLNHCIYVFEFFKKILIEIKQDLDKERILKL